MPKIFRQVQKRHLQGNRTKYNRGYIEENLWGPNVYPTLQSMDNYFGEMNVRLLLILLISNNYK